MPRFSDDRLGIGMTTSPVVFTDQEIAEFKQLYAVEFGENLNDEEAKQVASAFVATLIAWSQGEDLLVRYNNIALVNSTSNPHKA